MIEEQTLFILGAGASNCFGYPTGSALNDDLIHDICNHDRIYFSNKNGFYFDGEHVYNSSNLSRFSKTYRSSHPTLVDYFLAKNPDPLTKKIGIYGIALSLLNAESKHFKETSYAYNKDDWFSVLFNRMTSDILDVSSIEKFKLNKCSFIVFNYDRLLEYLFYEALTSNYGVTSAEVKNLVSELKIIHTFGRLPLLPHEVSEPNEDSFQYGKEPSNKFIDLALSSIITIHERKHDIEQINDEIKKAKRIFILGFGFAEENMELLNFKRNLMVQKDINATTIGLSDKKRKMIKGRNFPEWITTQNGDSNYLGIPNLPEISCKNFLEDYL